MIHNHIIQTEKINLQKYLKIILLYIYIFYSKTNINIQFNYKL